jgi:hypothetical protein
MHRNLATLPKRDAVSIVNGEAVTAVEETANGEFEIEYLISW